MPMNTFRILIADPLAEEGIQLLRDEPAFTVEVKPKLSPAELLQAVRGADALIVRSGSRVTAEVIHAADRLKVIGRAGVGLDNVDAEAASKRGIIVMNVPWGNTISTAEHTMSLILALARNIPSATQSMKTGQWNRSAFVGIELYGKTLGVIGLGKIGTEVAKRALAFGMRVVAHDPYLPEERARQLDIGLVSFEELLRTADYITVHTPLMPETKHLLSTPQFQRMKPGVRLINCARGGIIDEAALEVALRDGRVAGAALDVFEAEPPKRTSLITHEHVVATPHLGASTEEAQVNVAVEIAAQVRDALLGRGIRNAVNMLSLDAATLEAVQPYVSLAEKLGLLIAQLADGSVQEIKLVYVGDPTLRETSPITIGCLKGLLTPAVGESVNYVNAAMIASERGIKVVEAKSSEAHDFANLIAIEAQTANGTLTVHGSLFTRRDPRLVRLDRYYVDAIPAGHMLITTNVDKPGLVGHIGTILAQANINIAGMTFGRETPGGSAITVINVDSPVPPEVLQRIQAVPNVLGVKLVTL